MALPFLIPISGELLARLSNYSQIVKKTRYDLNIESVLQVGPLEVMTRVLPAVAKGPQ